MSDVEQIDLNDRLGLSTTGVVKLKSIMQIAGYWDVNVGTNAFVNASTLYWLHKAFGSDGPLYVSECYYAFKKALDDMLDDEDVDGYNRVSHPNECNVELEGKALASKYLVPANVSINHENYYGEPSKRRMRRLTLPFTMYTSWSDEPVKSLLVHKGMAEALDAALGEIQRIVGYGAIKKLHLHKTGGTYNHRSVRGSAMLSSHAWGAAIDIDPVGNRMGVPFEKTVLGAALLSGDKTAHVFVHVMHKHGFRTFNHDLQHWQYCNL